MTPDEQILMILLDGRASSASLAAAIGWHDRAVRRRLRRLIRDGYVFSPERGRYRLTAAGRAVMQAQAPEPVGPLESSPRDVLQRWRGRR